MLAELESKVKQEHALEGANYQHFQKWCDEEVKKSKAAIEEAQGAVYESRAQSNMAKGTAVSAKGRVERLAKQVTDKDAEIKAAQEKRKAEKAEASKQRTLLSKTLAQLGKAEEVVETGGNGGKIVKTPKWATTSSANKAQGGKQFFAVGAAGNKNSGKSTFDDAVQMGAIVRRYCADCRGSHKEIFYKRLTPVPKGFSFYDLFLVTWSNANNKLGVDFNLYSSLADARAGSNPWKYCNYNDRGIGFPRDCGPSGKTNGQWTSLTRGGKKDYAYFIFEAKGTTATYELVKSGGDCKSGDQRLANVASASGCALATMKAGGSFF